MLEVIAQPDHTFALQRRHRGLDGGMVDTVISRWPTKNAAFDALYAESAGIITRRQPRLDRAGSTITTSILTATALAIAIGALGLGYDAGSSQDITGATPTIYTVTLHGTLIVEPLRSFGRLESLAQLFAYAESLSLALRPEQTSKIDPRRAVEFQRRTAGLRKKRSFEKRGCTDRRNSHST